MDRLIGWDHTYIFIISNKFTYTYVHIDINGWISRQADGQTCDDVHDRWIYIYIYISVSFCVSLSLRMCIHMYMYIYMYRHILYVYTHIRSGILQ